MGVLIILLILISWSQTEAAESANIALPGCPSSCGGVPIPYPFGIGPNCSMSQDFEVRCITAHNGISTPYMSEHFNQTCWKWNNSTANFDLSYYTAIAIRDINLSLGQARITSPINSQCYDSTTKKVDYNNWEVILTDTPYKFNRDKNKFVAVGCDTLAYIKFSINQNNYWGGCGSWCYSPEALTNGTCSGIGCCQTDMPNGTSYIWIEFDQNYTSSHVYNFSRCSYAMLTEESDEFMFNTDYITTNQLFGQNTTAVIDWAIGNTTCDTARANKSSYACRSDYSVCLNSGNDPGYLCNCAEGYQGNPYLEGGCQGRL
ncbi:hypothetical protein LUZ61_004129 [Rhynchospora tenuis]|uniref:Wall-associated receptor kinase galacturonan-binding domain-containing protein n=1 Tax=Rhynchospora tenuis TaxID=198213 RepID=A0AAD5ZMK3_9POAL|nr:hypothetical protein LUZ61_004129 [Rhynchospora tenuis]